MGGQQSRIDELEKKLKDIEEKNRRELAELRCRTERQQQEALRRMQRENDARIEEMAREFQVERDNYRKIIEKKNYEATYPIPNPLKNHRKHNRKAFYIQILGCRGAGKSTFLNRLFNLTGIRKNLNHKVLKLKISYFSWSEKNKIVKLQKSNNELSCANRATRNN